MMRKEQIMCITRKQWQTSSAHEKNRSYYQSKADSIHQERKVHYKSTTAYIWQQKNNTMILSFHFSAGEG